MSNEYNYEREDGAPSEESADNVGTGASSVEYGPTFDTPLYGYAAEKKQNRRAIAVLVAIAVIVSVLVGAGGVLIGKNMTSGGSLSTPPTGESNVISGQIGDNVVIFNTTENAVPTDGSIASVASKSASSVVEIMTTSTSSYYPNRTVSGAGSGVLIGESQEKDYTYIVTNNHVVEGYETIRVRTTDGKEYSAVVVGTDWQSDIAVLRIEAKGLSLASFADSDALVLGQEVVAIGNPLGSLGGSVTNGIISGLSRTISIEGIPMTLLQTNAAINPGNSGGGLFDMNGNLIGVVNAKSVGEDVDNIGFAIPAKTAKAIASELIEKGYISGRADLGFVFDNVTSVGLSIYSYAYNSELSSPIEAGYVLHSVKVGNQSVTITSTDDYRGVLSRLTVGSTVEVVIGVPQRYGFYTQYESVTVMMTVHEYQPK